MQPETLHCRETSECRMACTVSATRFSSRHSLSAWLRTLPDVQRGAISSVRSAFKESRAVSSGRFLPFRKTEQKMDSGDPAQVDKPIVSYGCGSFLGRGDGWKGMARLGSRRRRNMSHLDSPTCLLSKQERCSPRETCLRVL
jgi:hypothetical protein